MGGLGAVMVGDTDPAVPLDARRRTSVGIPRAPKPSATVRRLRGAVSKGHCSYRCRRMPLSAEVNLRPQRRTVPLLPCLGGSPLCRKPLVHYHEQSGAVRVPPFTISQRRPKPIVFKGLANELDTDPIKFRNRILNGI